jgi:hypothetical protein
MLPIVAKVGEYAIVVVPGERTSRRRMADPDGSEDICQWACNSPQEWALKIP